MSGGDRSLAPRDRGQGLLTVDDLARLAGLHPRLVEVFVTLGIIEPVARRPTPLFPRESVVHCRRVIRIRRDFGGSYNAAALIVELSERIDELQRELRRLERNRS